MDKMQEEFEVWANGQGYATDKYDESELSDKYKHLAGTYVISETRLMIKVWQASRAALCVELPPQWFSRSDDKEVMSAIGVIDALNCSGVRYE